MASHAAVAFLRTLLLTFPTCTSTPFEFLGLGKALMQERRLRLGDSVDDYCPRERRITDHAVVAMVSDEIRQTRCTTCDAEHEYKAAKMPRLRPRF